MVHCVQLALGNGIIETQGGIMTTFIVAFEKHNGKQGHRTIRARNEPEAIAKCVRLVEGSFWHFIRDIKS